MTKTTTKGAVTTRPGATAPAIAEEKESQLPQLAGNFEFTDEEVQGGMDVGSEGYTSQYPYMVVIDGTKFKVVETSTRNELHSAPQLNAVAFYGHPVYRLHKGTITGLSGDVKDWPEEEQELAAQSYGSPFGKLQQSRGNFDATGNAQYLDNKDLRKLVKKRLYLVVALPGVLPKGELAICTFGGSALKPFQDYAAYVKSLPAPLPFIGTVMYLKEDKNEDGKTYQKLQLKPITGKDGNVTTVVPSKAAYDEKIAPTLQKVIETHQHAMRRQEQNADISPKLTKTETPAATYTPSPGEEDNIPQGTPFSDEDFSL